MARYVLANHHRSVARRRQLKDRIAALPPEVTTQPVPSDDQALVRALDSLSEADRELLIMRAWDELAVTDMAVLLGVTPNAVSVRLSRARKRLADALGRTGAGASGHRPLGPPICKDGSAHG